ncbi:ectonucleotide pyrophosphatase/phosphodiesterase family member 7-like [Amphiura filiformis]|uniref:ectonucleotide pyrophosphatase/phosphodiesterase family member 7-like n=1 Tax=Amphiura filiformis TaxID=82378 RepID=UPI003B21607E
MHTAKVLATRLFLLLFFLSAASQVWTHKGHGKVILLMVDGMRWDLFGLDLPELQKIEENGVRARWMDPVFLTLTNPSAFSIATGLYVESHGVLLNVNFNPETLERQYSFAEGINNTELWNQKGAEPIWVTAINQGHKAATLQYPGCNVAINGIWPTKNVISYYWQWYNYANHQAVDDTLSWLQEDDFDLALIYFHQPDSILHSFGYEDQRTIDVIKEIDSDIGYLFTKLESEGLSDITDVIIVSDHGHVTLDPQKTIQIYDYIDPEDVHMLVAYVTVLELEPKEGQLEKLYSILKGAHPNLHVFKQEDFPEQYHYGDNSRHLKIIGYVDSPWVLYEDSADVKAYPPKGSSHGYDNGNKDMKSIFFAQGPSFKKGYQKEPFESVNVYPLMCELLNLDPAPNNGSRANYADMLISRGHRHINTCNLAIVLATLLVILLE